MTDKTLIKLDRLIDDGCIMAKLMRPIKWLNVYGRVDRVRYVIASQRFKQQGVTIREAIIQRKAELSK